MPRAIHREAEHEARRLRRDYPGGTFTVVKDARDGYAIRCEGLPFSRGPVVLGVGGDPGETGTVLPERRVG